jgi:ferrous iron transport protein B
VTDPSTGRRVVALAGNPNTGKSSVFNMLTGGKQHVGNWPGKTVERVDGRFTHDGEEFGLVDLPGTYSLNASSPEEMIARDFLVGGEPDGAIVVVDAANLERNLYLAIQVLEIGIPTVVAINMSDVARSRGLEIDAEVLAEQLGVPAVPTVARTGKGLDELRGVIAARCTREGSR